MGKKIRSICRKSKRFGKGVLEGVVGTFIMPTRHRQDLCRGGEQSRYKALGFTTGSLATILGNVLVASYFDYNPLAFVPLVATNVISSVYEFGKHRKRMSYYESKKKEENKV